MATQLEKLMFSIDLLDRVSGPAGKIQKTLGSVADMAHESFGAITAGLGGVAASGYAIKALAGPAQEFSMAIGDVRSMEVAQDSLDILSDKAIAFSIRYGESAKDFVSSSYDIQSSIDGLAGGDLASFTNASNILSKATKSDADTITDYMGTMYGIFKKSANGMGKAQWVEQLTGQTATAVQMFKTTGTQMSGAFTSIGAEATSAGIAQAEQIAILGKLQSTMSGSEAGTKYKAFLNGISEAQGKLGLKFTDSNGRMLGMTDILTKLQGKFGETLDVAESGALKKAFGSDEAVGLIKLLIGDTTSLANSIEQIGKVKGMDKAMEMADSRVDTFQQWDQGIQAIRIGLGQGLLPVLLPALEGMAEGAGSIYKWTQEYPNLTKWIGYSIVLISGLTGAVAAFAVMGGIAKMATLGYGNTTKFAGLMTKFFSKESIIAKWSLAGLSLGMKVASVGMGVLKWALAGARTGFLWLAAAMYANPIGLIIGGVLLLTAGVAAIIYYWDDLKAAFLDTTWGKVIMGWIDKILDKFKSLGFMWDWAKDKLSWLPGFGNDSTPDIPKTSPSLDAARHSSVSPGGVTQTIANAVTNNSQSDSSSIHIGQVVTSRPINMQEISGQMTMGA